MRTRSAAGWCWILGSVALIAAGCGDDESPGNTGAKGGTAGTGGASGGSGGSGGKGSGKGGGSQAAGNGGAGQSGEGGEPSSGAGGDPAGGSAAGGGGGEAPAGAEVVFTIPSEGGQVEVITPTGNSVSFDFPPSAAGKTVTLTPATSSSIGWTDGRFQDVIRMEPDGTTFDDPVEIRPSNGRVLVFDYATRAEKSPAEGLELNGARDALLLRHFSTLVVVPPEYSCDSVSGWVKTDDHPACSSFGTASTRIDYTCKAYSYCLLITAHCCAEPGATECELGMEDLTLEYQPRDSNGGQYPHCDEDSGSGGAPGAGGTPGTGGTAGAGGSAGSGGSAGTSGGGTSGSGGGGGTSSGGPASPQPIATPYAEIRELALDDTHVYFTNYGEQSGAGGVYRVPLAGGTVESIATVGVSSLIVSGSELFLGHYDGIKKVAKSGGTPSAIAPATLQSSMVLSGTTLYFSDQANGSLSRVSTSGGAVTPLYTGESCPGSLLLDSNAIYYVNSCFSGNNDKSLMKTALVAPSATVVSASATNSQFSEIAIAAGYLYFTDSNYAMMKVGLAGGTPVAATETPNLSTLASDGTNVYGADIFGGSGVVKVEPDGTTTTISEPIHVSDHAFALDATHLYFGGTQGGVSGIYRIPR